MIPEGFPLPIDSDQILNVASKSFPTRPSYALHHRPLLYQAPPSLLHNSPDTRSSEFLEIAIPWPRMFLPHSEFHSSLKSEFNSSFLRQVFSDWNFHLWEILDDPPKNSLPFCRNSQRLYYATVNLQEAGWSMQSLLNLSLWEPFSSSHLQEIICEVLTHGIHRTKYHVSRRTKG